MNLNKAIIAGRLTRDPELKSLPSGVAVCGFALAVNKVWRDKNNQKQESTDFLEIVIFGKQAETSAQYLKKGQSALVEGRIQTRSWDKPDGTKGYRTEIVADRVQFGPRAGSAQEDQRHPPERTIDADTGEETRPGAKSATAAPSGIDYPEEEINLDDIPF